MWVGLVVLILSGKICYHYIERYWFSCNFVLVLWWTCSPCLKFPAVVSKFLYVGLCHLGVGILGTFSFLFAPLSFSLFLSLSFLMILRIDPRASWMQTDFYWVTVPAAPLIFLTLLLYLCMSTVLKGSREGKYICIAPDFRGNAFSFPHFVLCWPRAFLTSLCALSWST